MPGIDNTNGLYALHHFLANDGSDYEIIREQEDALMNKIDARIRKRQVEGQTNVEKLILGDTMHEIATKDGSPAYDINPGGLIIRDASITMRHMLARFMIDGTTADQLKTGDKSVVKIGLQRMLKHYDMFLERTKHKILAGDGSGRLCYVKTNTTTAQNLVEDDGTTAMSKTHPAWKSLIAGQRIDIVATATGLAVDGGVDIEISSISLSGSTVTLPDTVAVTGSKAHYIRLHTPHSDSTDPDYDTNRSLTPYPYGLDGLITTAASYMGYSADNYPNWYSPYKDMDGAEVDLAALDELTAEMDLADGTLFAGDMACIAQMRKSLEAVATFQMTEEKSIYRGVNPIKYVTMEMNGRVFPILSSKAFNNCRKIFVVNPDDLAEIGATLKPTWDRGKLTWSQSDRYLFDDSSWRFNRFTQKRKSHGVFYNCGAAYGWNKVVA